MRTNDNAWMVVLFGIVFSCCLLPVTAVADPPQVFTENRNIRVPFDGIAVAGPFDVAVTQGADPETTLTLQGNPDVLRNIETVVDGGSLKMRFLIWGIPTTSRVQIQLTTPNLINLIAAGLSTVTIQSGLQSKNLRLIVSGSANMSGTFLCDSLGAVISEKGNLAANLSVDNINAVISDASVVTIMGTTRNANLVVSGTSMFHGANLVAQSVSSTVSGSARVEVQAVVEMKAQVIEEGVVRYVGPAKIVTELHDDGTVEKL